MKLINILNLEAYQEDIKKLMQVNQINIFSEIDIQGYYKTDKSSSSTNWFANDRVGIDAKMNFVFLSDDAAQKLIEAIRTYNQETQTTHPIHAFVMNVEQAI